MHRQVTILVILLWNRPSKYLNMLRIFNANVNQTYFIWRISEWLQWLHNHYLGDIKRQNSTQLWTLRLTTQGKQLCTVNNTIIYYFTGFYFEISNHIRLIIHDLLKRNITSEKSAINKKESWGYVQCFEIEVSNLPYLV